MPYLWPITDPVLQEALDIALDYLEFTGQATPFIPTQWLCAILTGWSNGERRRIALANFAIEVIEKGPFTHRLAVYPN